MYCIKTQLNRRLNSEKLFSRWVNLTSVARRLSGHHLLVLRFQLFNCYLVNYVTTCVYKMYIKSLIAVAFADDEWRERPVLHLGAVFVQAGSSSFFFCLSRITSASLALRCSTVRLSVRAPFFASANFFWAFARAKSRWFPRVILLAISIPNGLLLVQFFFLLFLYKI